MGGKFHLKLNIGSRPIANKYREGKVKRTLKRELKVSEIAEREANEASSFSQDCRPTSGSALGSLRGSRVAEGDCGGVACGLLSTYVARSGKFLLSLAIRCCVWKAGGKALAAT